ncbi:MAG TPA: sensor histidine kinase, partial [Candidatus Diapherotrites archaeon]|nr:sensor histidine kinase [Candidatus Diapherotrites archaeon]
LSVNFTRPINNLARHVNEIAKGNFTGNTFEASRTITNEVASLEKDIQKMEIGIQKLIQDNIHRAEEKRLLEIKMLQSQINPHFLFNTLENINWMAQLNGVPEISETVSALAKLIDGSIGRGDRTISLREELEYIDNYMTVLKNRYEDKFEVIKILDDGLMDKKIPRLLIQPLVENAVKHGIGKSRRKGIIRLEAFREEGHIVFEVEDNGMGMTAEELEALNKRLQEDELILEGNGTAPARKSIGLENVNRRIKLLYGSSYGVKIESSYDEYTKVTVRIPDEQVPEGDKDNV